MSLIVRSKVKDVAKDMSVSGDVADALDKLATALVMKAAERANANGRRTVQAKDAFLGKNTAKTMLVVRSKVKDIVKKNNVSGDFADALNEMLIWTIMQGCERARANGRKTLQARDL